MSTAAMEAEVEQSVANRVAAAARSVAHMSHQARLLNSLGTDALEGARHAARRALKHRIEDAENLRDEVIHRVKRQPLQAIGAAIGVGALIGLAAGWIARGHLHCEGTRER